MPAVQRGMPPLIVALIATWVFAWAVPAVAFTAAASTGYRYDAPSAATTPTVNARTDASGARLGLRASPGVVRVVSGYRHAAKGEGALSRLGRRFADETGSYDPAELAKAVMRRKKGSIQRADLPPGSPPWDQVREMPMAEIEAAAKANQPGYKTILKLLQDKRFDR